MVCKKCGKCKRDECKSCCIKCKICATGPTGPIGPEFNVSQVAFVDINGSDITGEVENPAKPFQTLQAAVNAVTAAKSPGVIWTILLGDGTFGPVNLPGDINIRGIGSGSIFGPLTTVNSGSASQVSDASIIGSSPAVTHEVNHQLTIVSSVISHSGTSGLVVQSNGNLLIRNCQMNYNTTVSDSVIIVRGSNITNTNIQDNIITGTINGVTGDSFQAIYIDNTNSSSSFHLNSNTIDIDSTSSCSMITKSNNCLTTFNSNDNRFTLKRNSTSVQFYFFNDLSLSTSYSTDDSLFVTDGDNSNVYIGVISGGTLHINDFHWINIIGLPGFYGSVVGDHTYTATNTPGSLWYSGALSLGITGTTGLVGPDDYTKMINVPNATVQLPPAEEREGRMIYVKSGITGTLTTVIPSGSDTIDGLPSVYVLDQRDSSLFISGGTGIWNRLATAQHLVNPPELDTTVYIDLSGLDTNSGLSSSSPVATLNKALEVLFEKGWNRSAAIQYGSGTYNFPGTNVFNFRNTARGLNSQLVALIGGPLSIIASDTVVSADTSTLTPTNLVTITVGTILVPGAYRGLVISFTSGPLNGQKFQISDNTASTIRVLSNSAPSATDTFDILQNTTTMVIPPSSQIVFQNGFIAFQNIDVDIGPNGSTLQFISIKVVPDNLRVIGTSTSQLNTFDTVLVYSVFIATIFNGYPSMGLGLAIMGSSPYFSAVFQNTFFVMFELLFYQCSIGFSMSNLQTFNVEINNCNNVGFSAGQLNTANIYITDIGSMGFDSAYAILNNLRVDNSNGTLFDIDHQSNVSINNATVNNVNQFIQCDDSSIQFNALTLTGATQNSNITTTVINWNNVTLDSSKGIYIHNSTLNSSTLILKNITDPLGFSIHSSTWSEGSTVTFEDCPGPINQPIIFISSSNVNISTINHDNSASFSFTDSHIFVNSLQLKGFNGSSANSIDATSLQIGNVTSNGINSETTDSTWSLTKSILYGNSWNHDGLLTNTFFTISDFSKLLLTNSSIINTQNLLINSSGLCSINLFNVNVRDCAALILASDSSDVRLNLVTNEAVMTTSLNNFISVDGGEIFVTSSTGVGGTGILLDLSNTVGKIQTSTFGGSGPQAISSQTSSLELLNNTVTSSAGIGVLLETTQFYINTISILSDTIGISLIHNSKGYLNNASGFGSGDVGVNLQSGSSFSNGGSNTISGGLGDVRTGSAGISAWGALITDDFPPIVGSNYVTITPN